MTDPAQEAEERFKDALLSSEVPHLFCTGFMNAVTNSDIVVFFEASGRPVATLNLSFTMAKTLAKRLNETIVGLEEASGQRIMTTDEIDKALRGKDQ